MVLARSLEISGAAQENVGDEITISARGASIVAKEQHSQLQSVPSLGRHHETDIRAFP
jgi:hypothetical protein